MNPTSAYTINTHKINSHHKFKYIVPTVGLIALVILGLYAVSKRDVITNNLCSNHSTESFISKIINCNSNTALAAATAPFQQGSTISIDKSQTSSTDDAITQIVNSTIPGVVTVAASQDSANPLSINRNQTNTQNIGSGFIVRNDGLIVTNSHVVEDTSLKYNVILSGQNQNTVIPVDNIYRDNSDDIAILKINKSNLPTLKLGNSDNVKLGNSVIAIGSPLGEFTSTVTNGIISGLNRDVTAGSEFGSKSYHSVFQTDAPINPGNSGGPLLNMNGDVIGVNFATVQGASNISFALPINRVASKLSEFQQYGKLLQPFLGISYSQRTLYSNNNVEVGDVVGQVSSNSPAQKAGIKVGDIIIKANNQNISDTPLENIVQSSNIGDSIALTILRNNQTITVNVTVGSQS